MRNAVFCFAVALLTAAVLPIPAVAQLLNSSFEADDASSGDLPCATDWTCFNDAYTSGTFALPRTGSQVFKVFGPFFAPGVGAGAFQNLPAAPGQVWQGEVYAMNWNGDALQGNDFGMYKIEFLDADGNPVSGGVIGVDTFESNRIEAASTQDEWTKLSVSSGPAPAGTMTVRAMIVKVAIDGFNGGAVFWDDVTLSLPFTDIGAGLEGVQTSSVEWGDYDNDGDLDILLAGSNSNIGEIARVYRNDSGNFTDIGAGLEGVWEAAVAWGDYDNDGDLDIVLTGVGRVGLVSRIYRNDSGLFTDIGAGLEGVAYSSVDWGDYDNDGDLDILLTGENSALVPVSRIYRNDSGTFIAIGAGLEGVWRSSAAWGDYDNDGDLDILLVGRGTGSPRQISRIYRNDSGAFTDIGAGLEGADFASVAWGDYDNDGDLDFLLTGFTYNDGPKSRIYRNDSGSFTDIGAGLEDVSESSVAWGDYDNDGDLDILLVGKKSGGVLVSSIYRNDSGTFTDIGAGLEKVRWPSTAWGDYDNDGDLDILLAGRNLSGLRVSLIYRNNLMTANSAPSSPSNLTLTRVSGDAWTFAWDPATDLETPAAGLSYNLRVGVTPGGNEISTAMADAGSGNRLVAATGSTGPNTSWSLDLTAFSGQSVYWSVQSIDTGFAGSAFAPEEQFGVVSGVPTSPTPFALYPSAPNPFNPQTTIAFELPEQQRVSLRVFDIAGRLVRVLVDGEVYEQGRHEAIWRGRDDNGRLMSSGTYFYRLEDGTFSETKRMVLLK